MNNSKQLLLEKIQDKFKNTINPPKPSINLHALIEEAKKNKKIDENLLLPKTPHIGQSLMNLLDGGAWSSLMGLYGVDFKDYFTMDEVNKVQNFQIKEFNERILEIEDEKRWFAEFFHNEICKIKEVDSLKECNGIEIGSGTGVMAEWMSDKVNHLTCIDVNEELIGYCKEFHKKKKNISYHIIKQDIDFSNIRSIDFVYAQSVFIHLGVIDFYVYLKELKKSLNKDGLIYIDIIDGDGDNFNFEQPENKRQAIALKKFYNKGTEYLFTVNSCTIFVKVAKELGYELVSKKQLNPDLPNTHLIFKNVNPNDKKLLKNTDEEYLKELPHEEYLKEITKTNTKELTDEEYLKELPHEEYLKEITKTNIK